MGLLDGLGFAWNAGGLRVALALGGPLYEGEALAGTLTVTGGAVPVDVRGFDVRFTGSYTSRDSEGHESTHTDNLLHVPLRQPGTVAPGATYTLPFHALIPMGTGLKSRYEWYSVSASVDVPGARDPSSSHKVAYAPVRPIAALRDAFVTRYGWSALLPYRETRHGTPWIKLKFRPPQAQRHLFDGLAVWAQPVSPALAQGAPVVAHARLAAAPPTPFAFADGTRCALALECELNRQSTGLAGLWKEANGLDLAYDRQIAADLDTALERIAAMLAHYAQLGPVR